MVDTVLGFGVLELEIPLSRREAVGAQV